MESKAIQVRLSDADGKIYHWTIRRVARAHNAVLGGGRMVSGWEYTDHQNYPRFSEGNWSNVVARFKATADNYGMKLESALD